MNQYDQAGLCATTVIAGITLIARARGLVAWREKWCERHNTPVYGSPELEAWNYRCGGALVVIATALIWYFGK